LFFSIFGSYPEDVPAFWWSDLSVAPFIILTAAAITTATSRFGEQSAAWLHGAVFIPVTIAAILLALTKDNLFAPTIWAPPQSAIDRAFRRQQLHFAVHWTVNHATVSRFGRWCLPVAAIYLRNMRNYLDRPEGQLDPNQVAPADIPRNTQRIENEFENLKKCEK
jgi:hypothetical protein